MLDISAVIDLFTYLREHKVNAYVADQVEESLLEIDQFKNLRNLASVRARRSYSIAEI